MDRRPQLLVVDDEADIRQGIEDYFSAQGFLVRAASDGEGLRAAMARGDIDCVILDLRMPGEDGFSLCRYLRENHKVGIIMLTGSTDTIDRIVGLEVGADDYVAKPFDVRELLARVKSVMRRVSAADAATGQSGAAPAEGRQIMIGNLCFDLATHRLTDAEGVEIQLSGMEFALLRVFVENPNRMLDRDKILSLAHDRDWDPFDRSIDVRISRLRKKIEPDPKKPRYLRTLRGAGYIFSPDSD